MRNKQDETTTLYELELMDALCQILAKGSPLANRARELYRERMNTKTEFGKVLRNQSRYGEFSRSFH